MQIAAVIVQAVTAHRAVDFGGVKLRQSSKIALGGIVAALSVVLMLLTAIPSMTFVLPAIAGVLLMIMVVEVNKGWAFMVFVAVSLISVFIVPDRMASVMYILFFGYYPILKALMESKLPRTVETILKFVVFNVSIIVAYFLLTFVMGTPMLDLEFWQEKGIPTGVLIAVAIIFADVVFLVYDLALSKLVDMYLNHWRRHFKRIFK